MIIPDDGPLRDACVRVIKSTMRLTGGQIPEAAALLHVHQRSLYRWLAHPDFSDVPRAPPGKHRVR